MAQVKFGVCPDEFAPRVGLIPTFFGLFTPLDKPQCRGGEFRRRRDVTPGRYGTGDPGVVSCEVDPFGVPVPYKGGFDTLQTEQGAIRLPKDDTESWDPMFNPTVCELNVLPLADTRMRALSDRYYNR